LARDLENSPRRPLSRIGIIQTGRRRALVYFEGYSVYVREYTPRGGKPYHGRLNPYEWDKVGSNHISEHTRWCRCGLFRVFYARTYGVRWLSAVP
jgi:hypothetical protein